MNKLCLVWDQVAICKLSQDIIIIMQAYIETLLSILCFVSQGSHLPVGPEIPEAILRSLAYIAAHPPPAEASFKAAPPKPAYG